jgi:hypothetical protein
MQLMEIFTVYCVIRNEYTVAGKGRILEDSGAEKVKKNDLRSDHRDLIAQNGLTDFGETRLGHTFRSSVNKLLLSFPHFWINSGKNRYSRYPQNAPSNCVLRENLCCDSHNSMMVVNKIMLVFLHFASDSDISVQELSTKSLWATGLRENPRRENRTLT